MGSDLDQDPLVTPLSSTRQGQNYTEKADQVRNSIVYRANRDSTKRPTHQLRFICNSSSTRESVVHAPVATSAGSEMHDEPGV